MTTAHSSRPGRAEQEHSVHGVRKRLLGALACAGAGDAWGWLQAAAASSHCAALLHALVFSCSVSKQREHLKYAHCRPMPFHKHVLESSGSLLVDAKQRMLSQGSDKDEGDGSETR